MDAGNLCKEFIIYFLRIFSVLFKYSFKFLKVKGGSKMPRLLEHASGVLDSDETKAVVWTGSGDGVLRAIACAEALKRRKKIQHQITKIGYRKYKICN